MTPKRQAPTAYSLLRFSLPPKKTKTCPAERSEASGQALPISPALLLTPGQMLRCAQQDTSAAPARSGF